MAELSIVKNNSEVPDFTVSFDTFWTLYPRHVAKKDADRAWMRLSPEQQYAAVVAIASWRPIFLRREDERIPHPATWLNGDRWEDELPKSPTTSSAAHVPFAGSPHEPVARGALPAHVLEILRKLTGRKG